MIMGYPFWITNNNLGVFEAGASLTNQPILLNFGETEQLPVNAHLLNGELPPGVTWQQSGYQIQFKGVLTGTGSNASYEFTFRIMNNQNVSDRTFQIQVTQQINSFDWVTSDQSPLTFVSDADRQTASISAVSVPARPITYTCVNLDQITQGVSLVSNSGQFQIDLSWQPLTAYVAGRDLVFNNNRLYSCTINGVSDTSGGPLQPGINVVDTAYLPWTPSRIYTLNSVVTNDVGKVYTCISPGVSSFNPPGPTGTDDFIPDGSCVWAYQNQALVWSQVPENTQILLNLICEAQSGNVIINRTFSIVLVSTQADPIWITPVGRLLDVFPGTPFLIQLQVKEPDRQLVSYSALNLPDWIHVSITGTLSGVAPDVFTSETFVFDITASDNANSVSRTFEIQVVKQAAQLTWITPSELPSSADGEPSVQVIQAVTPLVGVNVTYGLVGGMLPVGVNMNMQTGQLQGFVEHHAQDKTYHFEIQASDHVQHITREFTWHVKSKNLGHYWTLSVPVWGETKNRIIQDNDNNLVDDTQLYLGNDLAWGRNQTSEVIIMSGVQSCAPTRMRQIISNQMHPWRMLMGDLFITSVPDASYDLLSVHVQDNVSPVIWQPDHVYVLNQRVSTRSGLQYQVISAGRSGSQMPDFTQVEVRDQQVVWQQIDSPNLTTSTSTQLPWYAYHVYNVGNTLIRSGISYVCVRSGTSAGDWRTNPFAFFVQDGGVVWQRTSNTTGNNTYWPNAIVNMRQQIKSELNWSNSTGSGAVADFQLGVSGEILTVTIVSPGTGYYVAPPVQVQGNGTQARLEARVGIVRADVLFSDTGVPDLFQFELDLGTGTPAQLLVDGVTQFDQAGRIHIIDPGSYTQIPSDPVTVTIGSSRVKLRLYVGIIQVIVLEPGTQYDDQTQIDFGGTEYDPVTYNSQTPFELKLPLAYVKKPQSDNLQNAFNRYTGFLLPVKAIKAELTGVTWQGLTRSDSDTCTWDAHATQFVEQTPVTQVTWDTNETIWDNQLVTFDRSWYAHYPNFSNTQFDQDRTLFDYYATLFDVKPTTTQSAWSTSYVWFMNMHA